MVSSHPQHRDETRSRATQLRLQPKDVASIKRNSERDCGGKSRGPERGPRSRRQAPQKRVRACGASRTFPRRFRHNGCLRCIISSRPQTNSERWAWPGIPSPDPEGNWEVGELARACPQEQVTRTSRLQPRPPVRTIIIIKHNQTETHLLYSFQLTITI